MISTRACINKAKAHYDAHPELYKTAEATLLKALVEKKDEALDGDDDFQIKRLLVAKGLL